MRVLLIDDEAVFAQSLRLALIRKEPAWEVDCVGTSEHALQAARETSYDLVAIDWDLNDPRASGLDVCRQLRADCSETALVRLMDREEPDERLAAVRAGADDHIVKKAGLAGDSSISGIQYDSYYP